MFADCARSGNKKKGSHRQTIFRLPKIVCLSIFNCPAFTRRLCQTKKKTQAQQKKNKHPKMLTQSPYTLKKIGDSEKPPASIDSYYGQEKQGFGNSHSMRSQVGFCNSYFSVRVVEGTCEDNRTFVLTVASDHLGDVVYDFENVDSVILKEGNQTATFDPSLFSFNTPLNVSGANPPAYELKIKDVTKPFRFKSLTFQTDWEEKRQTVSPPAGFRYTDSNYFCGAQVLIPV